LQVVVACGLLNWKDEVVITATHQPRCYAGLPSHFYVH